ncbi:MAG TPA: isoamylase early set domain-containing protein [bacterium]|nr:isoamylase early set domain-containing protein [bacterium]
MGLKKHYLKSRPICKVTFRLPEEAASDADKVSLVGDFNNWNEHATPLERLKSGEFKTIVELEPGNEYQYRYLIDGEKWENDWDADKYVPNPYGDGENSVVVV